MANSQNESGSGDIPDNLADDIASNVIKGLKTLSPTPPSFSIYSVRFTQTDKILILRPNIKESDPTKWPEWKEWLIKNQEQLKKINITGVGYMEISNKCL